METTNNGGNSSTITPTHLPITRSDPNSPYPTTFVTADSSSFKQVVQMLTGSSSNTNNNNLPPNPSSSKTSHVIPPIKTPPTNKKHHLYERRMKNNLLMINPRSHHHNHHHLAPPEILSPSVLDFPSLTLSPVTPLPSGDNDQFSHSSEEERGIAERGFYMHRSPLSTPRDAQPQLLPLFPLSSPRVSDETNSASD